MKQDSAKDRNDSIISFKTFCVDAREHLGENAIFYSSMMQFCAKLNLSPNFITSLLWRRP